MFAVTLTPIAKPAPLLLSVATAVPLHVGSFAGLGVKILWSVLALSFPVLAISGVIMWWRRVVRLAGALAEAVRPA